MILFTPSERAPDLKMSHYCKSYYDYVCNNYLNLRNRKLSPEEVREIVYCLTHQEELPPAIRIHTADLTHSNLNRVDFPEVVVGLFGRPIDFITDE